MLLFGGGGQLVEVTRIALLALPPLNTTLARRLMEQTKIFTALEGVRGRKPVDLAALEQLLVRFSHLVVEQTLDQGDRHQSAARVAGRLVALDARVVLHAPETRGARSATPGHPPVSGAIREALESEDGTEVLIRPIRPEDEPHDGRASTRRSPSAASISATST